MNQERIMNVLLAPHVSEKATMVGELNKQVVFKVIKDANKYEIKQAVEVASSAGNQELMLLHCISSYPAPIEHTNLLQMLNL